MSKRQWNISDHRAKGIANNFWLFMLCAVLALGAVTSCAPKYIERPSREGMALADILAGMNGIQSIKAVLSINYEKNDSAMSGDASLDLSGDALDLRIYYLGFLAGEIKENNGVIRSNPKMDKYKSLLLTDGLKDSFMWWTIKDYSIQEKGDAYVLKNFNRELTIGKKDLLPLKQTIQLDNGEELDISYDTPARIKPEQDMQPEDPLTEWYQSHLSIRYRNHVVKIQVKSYTAETKKQDRS